MGPAWATLDPINHLWINRAGIRRFPNAELVTFRAGHSPFLERPDDFVAAFHAFADKLDAFEASTRPPLASARSA